MLALLLLHLFISVTCLVSGFLVHTYVLNFSRRQASEEYKPVIVYLVTGLISITLISQWIILFHPLTTTIRIVIPAILLCCLILTGNRCVLFLKAVFYKLFAEPVITAGILFSWLLILVLNAGPTMMDDTESYHIQMVKWIEEYGSVPGLANLHLRYGFNSSWFTSIAFFEIPGQPFNFYTALNGTMSLWFSGYLLSRTGKFFSNSSYRSVSISIASLFIFILCIIAWPLIRGNAATCNYDFITTLIVFVLFTETMLSLLTSGKVTVTAEWIVWPVYIFTVRIINYPFLLLTLFGFFTLWRERRPLLITSTWFFSLLLILPFLTRNIILSGYAFYPSLSFDWFSVDWKPEKEKTLELLRFIKYFNRVNAGFQNTEVTASLGFPEWVFAWHRHLFWYDKLLLIPGITGFFAGIVFIKRLGKSLNSYLIVFFSAIAIQFISWFVIAPDPRFIYGSLLCGILSGFALLNNPMKKIRWIKLVKPVLILAIAVLPVFTITKVFSGKQYHNWIVPSALPQPPVKTVTINHCTYNVPEKIFNNWNSRCYATPLPCIYDLNPGLEMRGDSLSDGFRIKK
jgi:hypothetical protein